MGALAVKNTERKITKFGNSLGITIPAEILKSIDATLGDEMQIEAKNGEIVLRKSIKIALPKGISADFFDIFNKTVQQYDETFKALRDK